MAAWQPRDQRASGGPRPEAADAPGRPIRGAAPHGILTTMVEPRYRWQFAEAVTPTPDALQAARDRGLTARMAGILAVRGVVTADEIAAWFGAPVDGLHDTAALPDADRVLARLRLARDRGENVLVFGDFDADGLTGLAILTVALRRFGVAVEPYV